MSHHHHPLDANGEGRCRKPGPHPPHGWWRYEVPTRCPGVRETPPVDEEVTTSLDLTYENELIKIEGWPYRVISLTEGDRHEYQLTVRYEGRPMNEDRGEGRTE